MPATGNKSLHFKFIFLAEHHGLDPYITPTSLFCPGDKGQIEKNGGKAGTSGWGRKDLCYQASEIEK